LSQQKNHRIDSSYSTYSLAVEDLNPEVIRIERILVSNEAKPCR